MILFRFCEPVGIKVISSNPRCCTCLILAQTCDYLQLISDRPMIDDCLWWDPWLNFNIIGRWGISRAWMDTSPHCKSMPLCTSLMLSKDCAQSAWVGVRIRIRRLELANPYGSKSGDSQKQVGYPGSWHIWDRSRHFLFWPSVNIF